MESEFGRLIKAYREQQGTSQWDLAVRSDLKINQSTISRIERGEGFLRAKTAIELARVLEIPETELTQFYLYATGFPPDEVERCLNELQRPSESELNDT